MSRKRRPVAAAGSVSDTNREVGLSHDCCAPSGEGGVAEGVTASRPALSPLVEILYFDGCPNHEPALALVQRVSDELGVKPEIRLVNVPDPETAQRVRFLGSPTIRVDGRDV